jgi:hypothetical protein
MNFSYTPIAIAEELSSPPGHKIMEVLERQFIHRHYNGIKGA